MTRSYFFKSIQILEGPSSTLKKEHVLINNGADVNIASKSGVTALTISSTLSLFSLTSRKTGIVKDLIQYGADIDATLEWAKDHDNFEQVKNILIENGAIII